MRLRIIALEIVPLCVLFILIIIRFSMKAAPATPPKPPTWNQMGNGIDGEGCYDLSSWSVSLSENGEIVAIGAYGNDGNGDDSGHVRIFKYDPYEFLWGQIGAMNLVLPYLCPAMVKSWQLEQRKTIPMAMFVCSNGTNPTFFGIK